MLDALRWLVTYGHDRTLDGDVRLTSRNPSRFWIPESLERLNVLNRGGRGVGGWDPPEHHKQKTAIPHPAEWTPI